MLIVPFTQGAATPMQVAEACEGLTEFAFLVHEGDERIAPAIPMLAELAPVVTHDGDLTRVAGRVAHLGPSAVVTFADSTMAVAAAVAEGYGLPHNSAATCSTLRSKAEQRACLNAHGVGRVRAAEFFLTDPAEVRLPADVRFPMIIKPAAGASSADAVPVVDSGDLARWLPELTPGQNYVCEEYIGGGIDPFGLDWLADYLSVESAVSGGVVRHLGMAARPPLVPPVREAGIIFPATPPAPAVAAAIFDLAERAIGALGITTGLVHTEIKLSDTGPQVIEVNGRLGGSLRRLMPRTIGLDPVRLAVQIALGQPVPPHLDPPTGVAMMAYVHPPVGAVRLSSLPPAAALRALPGVFAVERFVRDGGRVDWRIGGIGRVCDVWIEADTLADLGSRYHLVWELIDRETSWA